MFYKRIRVPRCLMVVSIGVVAGWLSGCVTAQPAPTSPGVVVSAVSPDEVRETQATGSVVRWGGTITSINNEADGTTVIEIVSRPLHSGGRPIHDDRSAGRFIAETSDFLDPAIVSAGRDLTLVGTVTAIRDGKVGDADYRFPVVSVDTYRYWKRQVAVPPRHFPHWNAYHPYRYDPFWDDWPFPHHHPSRYRSGVSGSLSIILR